MKVIIAGGTGQVGQVLRRALNAKGHRTVVLSRSARGVDQLAWDGRTLGAWASAVDGADVVVNLAGRNVNCRYTKENLTQMLTSRVDSTRVLGEAIAHAARPPRVWLQMSTATIYAHRFDAPNDERTGLIGGDEPEVPGYWRYSIEIARAWERTLEDAKTPSTRKVAMRSAMVMSPDEGGIFDVLWTLARRGLGGVIASGDQFVSWIHEHDFVRAVELLIERDDLSGPVNLASPNPLPQRDFMRTLRDAARMPVGLPATKWMIELGAVVMRTDSELLLKSRRVVPGRLVEAGFEFGYPTWERAAEELAARRRTATTAAHAA